MALEFEIFSRGGGSLGDISEYCLTKQYTRRLSRPGTGRGVIPSRLASEIRTGDRQCRIRLNGALKMNGTIWFCEDDGDADTAYTEFVVVDPMIWWRYRPAMDADGDFSKPTFMQDYQHAPRILHTIVTNAINAINADGAPDGPMGINPDGFIDTGVVPVTGAPLDFPVSVGDIAAMLCDTGICDIVLSYNESSTQMATLNVYNQAGSDLSGSVSFDWQTGQYNARNMHRSEDFDVIGNAIRYYVTPKTGQRFRTNVTKDDGGRDAAGVPLVPPHPNSPKADTSLIDAIQASRDAYGKYVSWRTYDMSPDFPLNLAKKNLWKLWKTESLLRVGPRELVTVVPNRGIEPTFDIGDIIAVNAGPYMRGGFAAQQRIYEYTVREDRDGPIEIVDLVTSADGM